VDEPTTVDIRASLEHCLDGLFGGLGEMVVVVHIGVGIAI
jgi:hypothetical protein